MKRIEVGFDGELRVTEPEPPRRWFKRRRKPCYRWTAADVQEQVRACYLAGEGGSSYSAAVVLHTPPDLEPRRHVRVERKREGRWPAYCTWGFWWDDATWSYVEMGDSPDDVVRLFVPCSSEAEARAEARAWVGSAAVDTSYYDLPYPARETLVYAVRSGPANILPPS